MVDTAKTGNVFEADEIQNRIIIDDLLDLDR